MKKQLIVVVHGVGVREAGVATDLVAAALDQPPELTPAVGLAEMGAGQNPPGAPWLAHSSDDFLLHEQPAYTEDRKTRTFGVRLRRFRKYEGNALDTITNERVIADFYWGDISGTGSGLVQVLFGLLRVIFGLAHVVRENLASVFPGDGWNAWVRRLGEWSVLMIHGPIFALNLVLVGGFGLIVVLKKIGVLETSTWHLILIGVIATIGGLAVMLGFVRVYLLRLLCFWVVIWGIVTLFLTVDAEVRPIVGIPVFVVGAFTILWFARSSASLWFAWSSARKAILLWAIVWALFIFIPKLGGDSINLDQTICNLANLDASKALPYQRAGCWLVRAMLVLWGISLSLALLVWAACVLARYTRPEVRGRAIASPVIALMTLLAVTVASALFSAAMNSFPLSEDDKNVVDVALIGMPTSFVALVLLGAFALRIETLKKRALRTVTPKTYRDNREVLANRHRLIVSRILTNVLLIFVAILLWDGARLLIWGIETQFVVTLLALILTGFSVVCGWLGLSLPVPESETIRDGFLTIFGLLGFGVVAWFRGGLAQVINILTDVIAYVNNHSWTVTGGNHRTLLVERLTGLAGYQLARAADFSGYWLRNRIQDRMKVLLTEMIRTELPDDIVIIAHSQGTVIAMDTIDSVGQSWRNARPDGVQLRLITMGSPYAHLYNRYFKEEFNDVAARPNLAPFTPGGQGVLDAWTNIFRKDDFIGTHIGSPGSSWPKEFPVDVGGHTNYWVDPRVIRILKRRVGP